MKWLTELLKRWRGRTDYLDSEYPPGYVHSDPEIPTEMSCPNTQPLIHNYWRNFMLPNLKAFLDTIAFAEGTSTHSLTINDGYDVIVTGLDGPEVFTDYSAHPFSFGRSAKKINNHGLYSSASGRYQFMRVHWPHYRDQLNLPDFGPVSQDTWAIQLIREQKALDDVEAGRFDEAVGKVRNIWASLPGAGYGQPERNLIALRRAYIKYGGTIA